MLLCGLCRLRGRRADIWARRRRCYTEKAPSSISEQSRKEIEAVQFVIRLGNIEAESRRIFKVAVANSVRLATQLVSVTVHSGKAEMNHQSV